MSDVTDVPVLLATGPDGTDPPVRLYIEARRGGGEGEISNKPFEGLDKVTASIEAVSASVARAVKAAAPTTFSVELGFEIKAESSGLVALLVRSGGTATIKVSMEWAADG